MTAITPSRLALFVADVRDARRRRIAAAVERYSPAEGAVNCPPLRDLSRPQDRACTARHYWWMYRDAIRRNRPGAISARLNALLVCAIAERRVAMRRVNSIAAE